MLIEGQPATFTFHLKNNTAETRTIKIEGKDGLGLIYVGTLTPLSSLTYYYKARLGRAGILGWKLIACFYSDGTLLGIRLLGGRLITPEVIPTIILSKDTFLPKDEVQINLNLSNTNPPDLKDTLISLSIQNPNGNIIFSTNTTISLSSNASTNLLYPFTLPEASIPGIYIILSEAFKDGRRIGYGTSSFEIQKPSISLESLPEESELLQSFPNPANNSCWVPFMLANDSDISLEVYNILGQKVRTIEVGQRKRGSYTQKDRAIFWDLKNDSGQNISSGLYFYKIKADNFSAIKSMIVK